VPTVVPGYPTEPRVYMLLLTVGRSTEPDLKLAFTKEASSISLRGKETLIFSEQGF